MLQGRFKYPDRLCIGDLNAFFQAGEQNPDDRQIGHDDSHYENSGYGPFSFTIDILDLALGHSKRLLLENEVEFLKG